MRNDFSYIIIHLRKDFKGYLMLAANALLLDQTNAAFIK